MLMNNNDYIKIVENIKGEIREAQYKATLHVNQELIMLYYHIGQVVNEHKTWGSKFIENLAADIHMSFPNVTGYSARNLKYMAKLAATYPDEKFVQQAVAQIPRQGKQGQILPNTSSSERNNRKRPEKQV